MQDGGGPAFLAVMQGSSQRQPERPLVLVVDDDAAVRGSLKFSLELEGYAVWLCADGSEALAVGTLPDCSCLVIDQHMPGMSGLELVTELRDRRISAPVILITSHPNAVLRRQAMTAGVSIVEKPLLGNALLDTIRDAVVRQG